MDAVSYSSASSMMTDMSSHGLLLLGITLCVCAVKEAFEFGLIFKGSLDEEPSPKYGEDPADKHVCQHKLEQADHEKGLAPLLSKETNDHCAKSYSRGVGLTCEVVLIAK